MRLVDGVPANPADRAEVYELALSSLPDTVFLATADGTLAWVCPNVEVTFGRSPDAIVGAETVGSMLGPRFAPAVVLGDGDGDADLVANVDATVDGTDGERRNLLVTVRRLDDAAIEVTSTADGEATTTADGEASTTADGEASTTADGEATTTAGARSRPTPTLPTPSTPTPPPGPRASTRGARPTRTSDRATPATVRPTRTARCTCTPVVT